MQEVTGSSPVPSTKTEASDESQGLFFVSAANTRWRFVDGTGLEQGGSDAQRQSKQSAQWAVA